MADTSYLKQMVEPAVRKELEKRFNLPFASRQLELTTGGTHEFDAVSEDRSVVVGIKSSSGLTAGGKIPVGKINAAVTELYYLTLVDAETRLLVLTDQHFHRIFEKKMQGRLAPGLHILLIPLPPEIQEMVNQVQAQASKEVLPHSQGAR